MVWKALAVRFTSAMLEWLAVNVAVILGAGAGVVGRISMVFQNFIGCR